MGCNAKKAVDRQKCLDKKYNIEYNLEENNDNYIHYYIHNIIYYNNEDLTKLTNLERWKKLNDIYNIYFSDNKYIELAKIYLPNEINNFFSFAQECIDKGEEGLVLKLINGTYYPDQKKAWETIKLKREDSGDVICLGFEPAKKYYEGECPQNWSFWISDNGNGSLSKGNYYGIDGYLPVTKNYFYNWCSALKIGAYDNKDNIMYLGTVSSGLTDELKQKIKENSKNFLMKPIAIEYMEIYHETSLRSPRIIKFRDDINIKDCTLEKLL